MKKISLAYLNQNKFSLHLKTFFNMTIAKHVNTLSLRQSTILLWKAKSIGQQFQIFPLTKVGEKDNLCFGQK